MDSESLVSIIIPVYNAEKTLHIALASLQKQHYIHLEIIIVNDCSKDNTLVVIQNFIPLLKSKGMIVKVINHEKNQGVAVSRNTGLEQATGEFIYYVDADDRIE